MRFFRRSLIGLFLLAVTAGLLAMGGNTVYSALETRWADEPSQRPARERVFSVSVQTIEPTEITPELTSFGEVRSRRTLDLRAPLGGTVIEVAENFQEGGTVREGQLLARINPADMQAAMDVARTDLLEAEADLLDAQRGIALAQDELNAARTQADLRVRALERQRDLLQRNVGTAAAVEQAELAVSTAEQAVLSRRQALQQAEARVAQAETLIIRRNITVQDSMRRLANTEIFARFDGRLSDVSVSAGRLVANNERLAQLVDPLALEVAFRVSTSQYTRLIDENGALVEAPVEIRMDVFGSSLVAEGRLVRESAAVEEGTTGRLLFAEISNPKGLRPGDFVTVVSKEPALPRVVQLPSAAVGPDQTVLLIGEEDRLELASVEVLRRQGDDVIVRAPGLRGREVVTERSQVLGVGIKVKPVRPDAPAAQEPELVELDDERRARIIAFVEANNRIPEEVKTRMLGQLQQAKVPAQMVARIESRMGS